MDPEGSGPKEAGETRSLDEIKNSFLADIQQIEQSENRELGVIEQTELVLNDVKAALQKVIKDRSAEEQIVDLKKTQEKEGKRYTFGLGRAAIESVYQCLGAKEGEVYGISPAQEGKQRILKTNIFGIQLRERYPDEKSLEKGIDGTEGIFIRVLDQRGREGLKQDQQS